MQIGDKTTIAGIMLSAAIALGTVAMPPEFWAAHERIRTTVLVGCGLLAFACVAYLCYLHINWPSQARFPKWHRQKTRPDQGITRRDAIDAIAAAKLVKLSELATPKPRRFSQSQLDEREAIWRGYYAVLEGPARDAMLFAHQLVNGWEHDIVTSGPEQFSAKLQKFAELVAIALNEMAEITQRTDYHDDIGHAVTTPLDKLTYSPVIYKCKEALSKLPPHPSKQVVDLIAPQFEEFQQSYLQFSNWITNTKTLIKNKIQEDRASLRD